jgi:hypothetical protein
MPNLEWPWAIVLCRFSDMPAEPQPAQHYRDLYTANGTRGMCDYWRTVTCGALGRDARSRVFVHAAAIDSTAGFAALRL